MRWSRGARGRVPRLAHRRVSLFFWPMRASSCHHSSISTPFGSLARIFASSAGKFFLKALDGQLVLRVVARPRRDLGEAERLQLAPDRGLVERDGERLQEPPRQVLAPPAHDAVDRRDRAGLNNLRQCAAVIGVELRGCAGDFPSTSPSGPRALKRSTQSRMICRPTPPIRDASVLLPPS